MSIVSHYGLQKFQYGDHLAHLFSESEEQIDFVAAFFRHGLELQDKCAFQVTEGVQSQIREMLEARLELRPEQSDLLSVLPHGHRGETEAGAEQKWLDKGFGETVAGGLRGVRLVVDMTTAQTGPAMVAECERYTEQRAQHGRWITVCQYDRSRMAPELLLEALRAHRRIILNGFLVSNPYYEAIGLHSGDTLPTRVQGMLERLGSLAEDATARASRERRARFLSQASLLMGATLDLNATFKRIADLAVPFVGDWCLVDVVEEPGRLGRTAIVHREPAKVRVMRELRAVYSDIRVPSWLVEMLQSGRSVIGEVSDSILVALARSPEHLEAMRGLGLHWAMLVPLVARGRVLGAISFVTAESRRRYDQSDLAFAESLARVASVALENARLYEEAQRQSREALALETVAREITSSLDSKEVFQRIVEHARELCQTDLAIISTYEPVADQLRARAWSGTRAQTMQSVIFKPAPRRAGRLLLRSGQPLVTEDYRSDPLFAPDVEDDPAQVAALRQMLQSEGVVAQATIPLRLHGSVTGLLWVGRRERRRFSDSELSILARLADQAAIAVENSRLYSQASLLAANRERLRVANELHDTLSQWLFSIGLKLEWCQHKLPRWSKARPKLEVIRRDVGSVMEQLRNLISEHSGTGDAKRPLTERIATLASQFHELTGIMVNLAAEADVSVLDERAQDILYNFLREALTNVASHTDTTRVAIRLCSGNGQIRFEVVDDGVGTGPQGTQAQLTVRPTQFGLRQIAQRLEAIGGRLELGAAQPRGLRLAGTLPVVKA